MKKLLYLILLFLILPLTGFSQNDSIALNEKQQSKFNNQMDFDVMVLAISMGYKFGISENWLVGFSLGIGPVVSFGYADDVDDNDDGYDWFATELLRIGIVMKKSNKTNNWSFEVEPRLGWAGLDEGETFYSFNFGGGIFYGGKVQIGVRTAIGKVYNTGNKFFFANTLIVRIPLKTN